VADSVHGTKHGSIMVCRKAVRPILIVSGRRDFVTF
jgi:hypothetical protein